MLLYLMYFLLLLLEVYSQSCTKLNCTSITNETICGQQKDVFGNYMCQINYYPNSTNNVTCYGLSQQQQYTRCNQIKYEYNCTFFTSKCFWTGQKTQLINDDYTTYYAQQKSNSNGTCRSAQCSDFDSQITCSSFESTTCDFQNGKCIQVYDCASIQSVHYCRVSRLSRRCAALSDGKALTLNQKSAGIFESYSCAILNCKYWSQIYGGGCQPFVNGYQCFNTSTIACDQCSNYQNINSCINTGQCTWNANSNCTDIQCAQLTSPIQCGTKSLQCQWYNSSLSCGLKANLTNAYCYPEYKYGQILLLTIVMMLL